MLNPALKRRFMQEFSRFSRILVRRFSWIKISPLKNKKRSKNKKNKTFFTSMLYPSLYVFICLSVFLFVSLSLSVSVSITVCMVVCLSLLKTLDANGSVLCWRCNRA